MSQRSSNGSSSKPRAIEWTSTISAVIGFVAAIASIYFVINGSLTRDRTPTTSSINTSPSTSAPGPSTPSTVFLAELSPNSGSSDFATGPVRIGDKLYSNSVIQILNLGNIQSLSYRLDRRFKRLTSTIALSEDSDETSKVKFQIFKDGQLSFSKTVEFGQEASLSLDVSRVSRLRLTVTSVAKGKNLIQAAWADAALTS